MFVSELSTAESIKYTIAVLPDKSSTWVICKTIPRITTNPVLGTCDTSVKGMEVMISAVYNQTRMELCDVGFYGSKMAVKYVLCERFKLVNTFLVYISTVPIFF